MEIKRIWNIDSYSIAWEVYNVLILVVEYSLLMMPKISPIGHTALATQSGPAQQNNRRP